MQIYRYFKFTDFIICKFARKFIFTAFRYTHDDDGDDDDGDDDGVYLKAVNINLRPNLQIIKSVNLKYL